MNLSSLYKKRPDKNELLSYTEKVVSIMSMKIKGELSKEEMEDRMAKIINSFLKKHGE